MDIRTCKKPELDALNDRAKVWREQHSPNPDGIKDQSARPPQDQQAPAKDLRGCLKSPDSRQILTSMCSLQPPESWHEACTTFCELGIGRTFQNILSDRSGAVKRMTFRNETMGSRAWIESTPGVSEDGARYRSTGRCAGAPKGSSGPCRNSRAARTDVRRTARGPVNRDRRTSRKSAGTIRKRRPGSPRLG